VGEQGEDVLFTRRVISVPPPRIIIEALLNINDNQGITTHR
jgi:hypothetical protein